MMKLLIIAGLTFAFNIFSLAATELPSVHPAELYIPIGQSPGISNSAHTWLGVVEKVVVQPNGNFAIELMSEEGSRDCLLHMRSIVYLDRSGAGKTNLLGSVNDIKSGDVVEIYQVRLDSESLPAVVWLKIKRN